MLRIIRPCNFAHWARAELWELSEAVHILVGAEPPPGGQAFKAADEVLTLMVRAAGIGALEPVIEAEGAYYFRPLEVIHWAKGKGLALPAGLEAQVQANAASADALRLKRRKAPPARPPGGKKKPARTANRDRPVPPPEVTEAPKPAAVTGDVPGARPKPRRAQQIEAILAAIATLGYDPLSIPDGGKTAIRQACLAQPSLFTDSAFDHAWKEAAKQARVRMANHEKFAPPK